MTRSVRYQPILHTLYYTLHTEHAYCLSYRFLNNVVLTTVIEMVEMVEILDGRLGKRSVERVRYDLLHLVIVKYGDISLVLCISTRLRLVTILSLLVKYLVIFHADPCNQSYISCKISIEHPNVGLALLAQLISIFMNVVIAWFCGVILVPSFNFNALFGVLSYYFVVVLFNFLTIYGQYHGFILI